MGRYLRHTSPLCVTALGVWVAMVVFCAVIYRRLLVHSLARFYLTGRRDRGLHVQNEMPRMNDSHVHSDDTMAADDLANKVRVLCWVMTEPQFRDRALAVKRTWGPRCNILLFFSSVYDKELPTIALNVSEGRENLMRKIRGAFRYIYENYYDQADWFIKCDDSTYVMVENLRSFLSDKNTSAPMYYGQRYKHFDKQGWHSGGAGYILSKEALERFVKRDLKRNPELHVCEQNGETEDVYIGQCLEKLGVKTGNSTDTLESPSFPSFPT